ncbi:MAG: RNA-binding domain-containing protein [Gammaproteobacteria bacterium]
MLDINMDITQIEELIKQGESQRLEFKKSTSLLRAAFESICAFLNAKGGTVLIGVTNSGEIVGQDVADITRLEIAREIKKIEPTPSVEVHYISINEKKYVIAIEVSSGKHAPYVYDGRAFERNQTTTERMSQHRYEQFIVRRGQLNHSWESQIAVGYDVNSLDHEQIRKAVKLGVDKQRISVEVLSYDIEHILTNWELLKDGHLINAAVVLFAKKIHPDHSNCLIRLARFRGTDKMGDFIDNQRVQGNAFQILSSVNDFVRRHLPIASFFESDSFQRIDQPAVPMLALREAIVNAISHRDYANASSISLSIFDDRLVIWNNGELPPQLTIEDLKKRHESYPRNKIISTIFYDIGWVEGWGTGTVRMISYCQKNKTPEPEFEEYSGGFSVIFRLKEPMSSVTKKEPQDLQFELTTRQKEIVDILKSANELTTKNIMQNLSNPPAERTLRDDLASLKSKGIINSRGHARTTVWFIVKK